MALMSDLPASEREMLTRMPCPGFERHPWVRGGPLSGRTIATVNTAGLIPRGARPLTPRDPKFRIIPDDLPAAEIVMSHVSVNFDRTGFQRDLECVLPRERLRELARAGGIGGVSHEHYSFMGATVPEKMEPHARGLARRMKENGVDGALLIPV